MDTNFKASAFPLCWPAGWPKTEGHQRGTQGNADLPAALLLAVCHALTWDALRFKPREKQFSLLLSLESFGRGQDFGVVDLPAWTECLADWRTNEVKNMLKAFRKNLWLTVEVTEGTYRLLPDRWPGWATAAELQSRQGRLAIRGAEDLNRALAELCQANAVGAEEVRMGNAVLAKISQVVRESTAACENFARGSDEPPPGAEKPNVCGDSLRNLRAAVAVPLRETGGLAAPLKYLKEVHKGIKPFMDFESLSSALVTVELSAEAAEAYHAMCGILGGQVMEGGDRDHHGHLRTGDGGKWRTRWVTNRRKTVRVLAALCEEIKEGRVKTRGARAEMLWKELCAEGKH